ncbi:SufD family Fe-S cluster assembly protein [Gracilinema caldarium]|uniref:SufBD protein n=1 Tax=Gracilinema caldarium (strain ATCC 51460 / DSM 7334 / H1) TaxID=744872 RepID=F8EZX4_GRAC1|nr:SufD family Fe-S cluster assembly protein [Gracilinema caldarium]AEJ18487.1 SufBD protein [Gracilinema caldarium DSM 7334]
MINTMIYYIDELREPIHIQVSSHETRQLLVRFDYKNKNLEPQSYSRALTIEVSKGGNLQLYIMSTLPTSVQNQVRTSITLHSQSSLTLTELLLDDGESIYYTEAILAGSDATLDYAGAYGARNRTKRVHTLTTHHLGKNSRSRTTLKSALKDSAHLVFQGLIHVDKEATGTDAYLSNRNMVMNDGCRAESLPQLQIETDEVACSHGSTTGGVREEELFYLMSRGLSRIDAKRLLVLGHLASILDRFPPSLAEEAELAAASFLLNSESFLSEVA